MKTFNAFSVTRLTLKWIATLIVVCVSFSANSTELNDDNIIGKWLILNHGEVESWDEGLGDDYWIFKDGEFLIELSGVTLSPTPYRVDGSNIMFGTEPYEATIDVVSISASKMEVTTSGITQFLEKSR